MDGDRGFFHVVSLTKAVGRWEGVASTTKALISETLLRLNTAVVHVHD